MTASRLHTKVHCTSLPTLLFSGPNKKRNPLRDFKIKQTQHAHAENPVTARKVQKAQSHLQIPLYSGGAPQMPSKKLILMQAKAVANEG